MKINLLTNEFSFPDEDVESWKELDDTLEIQMSGVFYEGVTYSPAKIVFSKIVDINSSLYSSSSEVWIQLDSVEPLIDICEFSKDDDDHFTLNGFGAVTGQWISIRILAKLGQVQWA